MHHEIFRLRGRAVGAHAVFDGDEAGFVFAKRRVNGPLLRRDVAVDDGEVFLGDGARLPDFAEFAGGGGILGDDDEAGGFAVEAVNQMRREVWGGRREAIPHAHGLAPRACQINPGAADETGIFVALGGMADEVGGLVDDEQIGVLMDDGEQFFQARSGCQIGPRKRRIFHAKRKLEVGRWEIADGRWSREGREGGEGSELKI